MWKFVRVCALAVAAVLPLVGCLPEDSILLLEFSPDGQKLAVLSEKAGLQVVDIAGEDITGIAGGRIDDAGIAWLKGGAVLAFAGAPEGSYDMYLADLDGVTTRVSSSPGRESFPMAMEDALLYLSTDSGVAELTSHPLHRDDKEPATPPHLPHIETGMVHPSLSPDGQWLAFFTFEELRPQLYVAKLADGKLIHIAGDPEPFSLLTQELNWAPDSSVLLYLRGNAEGESQQGEEGTEAAEREVAAGKKVLAWRVAQADSRIVAEDEAGIRWPRALGNGDIVYARQGKLVRASSESTSPTAPGDQRPVLNVDFPVSRPAVSQQGDIAFAVVDRLVGLTSASLEHARILMFGLEDKFLLAEEYFRTGSSAKSYRLYEELAASVTRTRDPEMARFIYIANLRRLGRTKQAVGELEKLLEDRGTTQTVPREYLWRLLGYSYLLELDDLPRARASFAKFKELTSSTRNRSEPDSALNALQILRMTRPEVARLYARAVKARLDGNFPLTDKLFGELLTTASEVGAVRREYINALDGFDEDVYFFSPSQRPFQPTRAQRAEYLQRFVDRVSTATALSRGARLDLFLLRIEMGNYDRARALLSEALTSAPVDSRPEGILEVFRNYLETPEPQPWINAAMPEVFWHPEIRAKLEPLLREPGDRLLVLVAATKMALLDGNADAAREQANAAGAEWSRLLPEQQTGDEAILYGRLLMFRAREAELRGLYAEAAAGYDQALQLLEQKHAGNFEMQEEIRYRADLLRMFVAEQHGMLRRLRDIEEKTGTELVNPTWERQDLMSGVRDFVGLYDSTTATVKLWAAYEAGVCFGKLRLMEQSRAALMLAAADSSPTFLQRKAMVELAALDEYLEDPWNAARWYARVAAIPTTGEQTRLWCSYQIARLHISMGYKVGVAREALGVIVSTRPDSALAVQAQELLVNTNVR